MRTGDKLWEKEIGSTQNMLLSGDYLFVISNRNILYAIEKYSGDIAWTLDIRQYLKEEDDNDTKVIYAAPPLMLNGNIYLAFSNGKVLRIDAHQGQLKAKTDLEIDISNGLIAAEEYVVAVSDDADVVVFK
jgi:outer membrane protein assembly factor BamB